MRKKCIYLVCVLTFSLPVMAQTFEVNDISSLKSAIASAEAKPNEEHKINISGNIQFDSTISELLNLELSGTNPETLYNFDLNNFTLDFLGSDKTGKISNLNILADKSNSGIISRNKKLTFANTILNGHTSFGKELIKNTAGELTVNNSKFLNNYSEKGAGINFSGTNLDVQNSEFSGNKAYYGGAIYVDNGNVSIPNSKLNNNTSTSGGGALYINSNAVAVLDKTIFDNNSVSTGSTGGAIINKGDLTIKNNSVFTNNQVSLGSGGAISNSGTLNMDSTLFENNQAKQDGGAITDTGSTTITNSTFRNNKSLEYYGGAIVSSKNLTVSNSLFDKNTANTYGGAIAVMGGKSNISDTKFTNNVANSSWGGGALINYLGTVDLKGENLFQNNSSQTKGGAITATTNSATNIESGSKFINNSANELGGAIFSQGTIHINANSADKDIIFSGNTDSTGSNAIHLDIYPNPPIGTGTLNINVSNGAKVIFEDNISGVENTIVNMQGTSSYNDKVYLGDSNEYLKSNVNLKDISLEFYNQNSGMPNALINAENTHFNFMNNSITQNKLNLNLIGSDNSFSIDVDPANSTSDYFELSNNRSTLNNIVIRDINVMSEPTQSSTTFNIFDHDRYGTNLTLSDKLKNQTVYGAIKKYSWVLSPKLTLVEVFGFNPNIQRYQSATASAFINQMLSYDYSLNRTDEIYSNLREMNLAQRRQNSYVYMGRNGIYLDQYNENGSALWIRPYVNLESFHLSGAFHNVGNQSYGTVVGIDSPIYNTKNNWKLVSTLYGAYIGSTQQFAESNINQNGGYLGYLLSAFKDNFYTGWTINGGGLGVESNYAGGKDDYGIITAGTALKFAYNLKFKKLIFQPNFTTAYTFLNPTNLVNFQSVDLNQSQVNGLTIMPSMRITYRNEHGFEPYIFAGCVIPIMSDIKANANSTQLEKLNLNTWAQFGAGIRKQVSERVTCFAENIIRTGGRVGWGFMFNVQVAIK